MVATALVIVIVAVYILMNAACIGFFARRGPPLQPVGCTGSSRCSASSRSSPPGSPPPASTWLPKFITPLAPPISYMGPGVAGFMIIGVIYLIYLYRRHPRRVEEVGLVHLDPIEEYEATDG